MTSKVFRRGSFVGSEGLHAGGKKESGGGSGSNGATKMYDGDRPGERRRDDWDFEGAGESMYLGSWGSADGRLHGEEMGKARA